jgi:ribulose-5-phosphate 4-epimerase/fuculose-1-phosphate aldolase
MTNAYDIEIPSMKDKVSDTEWETRLELAALYRIGAHMGYQDVTLNHFTARVPDAPDHFLIKPTELMFEEVTASSLLCYSLEDKKIHDQPLNKSPASFNIHGTVLKARPDINCVMHLHSDHGAAVSAQEKGLRFISQDAMRFWNKISYHNYEGLVHGDGLAECDQLVRDLGENTVLMLNNHGTMVVGHSIGEAFLLNHFLERAMTIQIHALAGGGAIIQPSDDVCEEISKGWIENRPNPGIAGARDWNAIRRQMDRMFPDYRT